MSMRPHRGRRATLAILFALCIVIIGVGQGEAKEYEIDGTADCGLRSGRRCSIDAKLALWTDDVSGKRERVEVDVSWIDPDDLDAIDQDDRVCLILEDRYATRLKAVGVSRHCKFDGTYNGGLSTGSRAVSEQPDRDQDEPQIKPFALTPTPTPTGGSPGGGNPNDPSGPTGTVTGIVTNALTGQPLPGAIVRVDGSGANATSGNDGRFVLSNAPAGARTLRTSATGFVTETRTVTIVTGSNTEQSIALTPGRPGGEITIVLTWSSEPRDLDAHLSGPNRSGGRFHIYYANAAQPQPNPYATLDVDDVVSFGPETITISRDSTTGNFVPGEYRYWVHNFSQTPEFDVSDARVSIASGGVQIDSFGVPGGAAGLDIWLVANLTIDAAGNVTVNPVQSFTTGFDTTPFAIPSGATGAPTRK